MPQENNIPVAKTEPTELEFGAPQPDNPRIKKRNLKAAAQSAGAAANSRPASGQERPAVYAQPAAATHSVPAEQRPAYTRPSGTEERPQPAPATGVLYYSNGSTPKRPETMKAPLSPSQATRLASGAAQAASHSLPQRAAAATQARPSSSSTSTPARPNTTQPSTPSATPTRPAATTQTPVSTSTTRPSSTSFQASSANHVSASAAAATQRSSSSAGSASSAIPQASRSVSTTVAGPSATPRGSGVSDYRANIERQSREQKSVGNILNILVYSVIAILVCGGFLAAYGAHDVYKQLHAQSTTVTELDTRYTAANQNLTDALKSDQQLTQQLQTQLGKAQELIIRQQDVLTKMQASLDAQTEALRQERNTRAAETSIRAQETSALRSRLRALESKNQPFRP